MKPERIEVGERDVLVFRNLELPDESFEEFIESIHKQYPKNFVLLFAGDETLETLSEEQLEVMLLDLIEHQKAANA